MAHDSCCGRLQASLKLLKGCYQRQACCESQKEYYAVKHRKNTSVPLGGVVLLIAAGLLCAGLSSGSCTGQSLDIDFKPILKSHEEPLDDLGIGVHEGPLVVPCHHSTPDLGRHTCLWSVCGCRLYSVLVVAAAQCVWLHGSCCMPLHMRAAACLCGRCQSSQEVHRSQAELLNS